MKYFSIILFLLLPVSASCNDFKKVEMELREYAKSFLDDPKNSDSVTRVLPKVLKENRFEVVAALKLNDIGLSYIVSRDTIEKLKGGNKLIDDLIKKKNGEGWYKDISKEQANELVPVVEYLLYKLNKISEKANK